MVKRYWFVLLVYIIAQFSGLLGFPLLSTAGVQEDKIVGFWTVISFAAALAVILFLMRTDMKERHLNPDRSGRGEAALWSVLGIFMALAAQSIAGLIEVNVFGIEAGSENTEMLVEIAKITPIFIFVTSVIGPILEEVVFRKIIFGSLYKRFNFWISGIASSLIFAAVHFDPKHLLIYTAMGLTFAYLYVKTKRIIVPIIAHVAMNSLVVGVQIIFEDQIREMQQQAEMIQSFIGGF